MVLWSVYHDMICCCLIIILPIVSLIFVRMANTNGAVIDYVDQFQVLFFGAFVVMLYAALCPSCAYNPPRRPAAGNVSGKSAKTSAASTAADAQTNVTPIPIAKEHKLAPRHIASANSVNSFAGNNEDLALLRRVEAEEGKPNPYDNFGPAAGSVENAGAKKSQKRTKAKEFAVDVTQNLSVSKEIQVEAETQQGND